MSPGNQSESWPSHRERPMVVGPVAFHGWAGSTSLAARLPLM
jgi:hypothetical protein